MERLLLIKYGEIMLKGLNRPVFEKQLERNIKRVLDGTFGYEIFKEHGRIFVAINGDASDYERAADRISRVFGIVTVAFAYRTIPDSSEAIEAAIKVAAEENKKGKTTFKVETRRPNKNFHYKSMEFNALVGEKILEAIEDLSVDVHNPDFTVYIEIRKNIYVYSRTLKAGGGIPVGSSGRGVVLLSGGIDSPVAAYMMAKRGLKLEAVYFHSHPYTTELAKEKVIDLAKILSIYCGGIRLHIVNFTEAQMTIYEKCPHEQLTIIMRRVMMRVAEEIALKNDAGALVTGESLAQVASQTLESLHVTNSAVNLPVFRPLVGMDKYEAIEIAKKIETYEISIRPYEDCCTIFVAKHPETKPRLERILESEKNIDFEGIVKKCLEDIEIILV
ncbi:MAG: tRNA 4-thiouridine(8) synthase ThiI [Clostridia bacterium]|nr:tRNA 4-thiouridine(8) synthase ThiI [Clostridia bacterium]